MGIILSTTLKMNQSHRTERATASQCFRVCSRVNLTTLPSVNQWPITQTSNNQDQFTLVLICHRALSQTKCYLAPPTIQIQVTWVPSKRTQCCKIKIRTSTKIITNKISNKSQTIFTIVWIQMMHRHLIWLVCLINSIFKTRFRVKRRTTWKYRIHHLSTHSSRLRTNCKTRGTWCHPILCNMVAIRCNMVVVSVKWMMPISSCQLMGDRRASFILYNRRHMGKVRGMALQNQADHRRDWEAHSQRGRRTSSTRSCRSIHNEVGDPKLRSAKTDLRWEHAQKLTKYPNS